MKRTICFIQIPGIAEGVRWQVFALGLMMLILAACGPPEIELAFETIDKSETSGTGQDYEGKESKLSVILEPGAVASLGNTISPDAQVALNDLDYGQYFGVAVFQGKKGTNGYGVEIQRVVQKKGTVILYTHFTIRDPEMVAADVITSPYDLIKLPRSGLAGEMEFILNVDGEVLLRQTVIFP